uniref:Putative conserved secreted protein n=1 Tax=Lutzomyia longipalpis TaxID=7200 RepID=A0A1B0CXA0_LUTLO
MRKYQQLALVIISLISVAVLIMYRNENSKLRYILEVVNFFGRSDAAALVRIENSTAFSHLTADFSTPLPMWTRLGSEFHAYAAFWHKNTFTAGGEVVTIVVGLRQAIVNFRCQLQFPGRITLLTGKFEFTREEQTDADGDFLAYRFLCKVTRDFGTPENVAFINATSKTEHFLPIRSARNTTLTHKSSLVACVDMVSSTLGGSSGKSLHIPDVDILQYFIHHQIVGIDEFIVYDRYHITNHIQELLYRHGIKISILPYNFPFTEATEAQNRPFLEMDCLLRARNEAKYAFLTTITEYFYPEISLKRSKILFKTLAASTDVFRFDVTTKTVCTEDGVRILAENHLYDPNAKTQHPFLIYRIDQRALDSPRMQDLDPHVAIVHRR